jgi:hypothetical protein
MQSVSPLIFACEELSELVCSPRRHITVQPVESLAQLRQLWEIDKEAYGDCSISFERFQDWWERYPWGSRILLQDGIIQASIGLYPLSERQAIEFANGTIREEVLRPVTQAECAPNPQRYWYASGIVVVPHRRGESSPLRSLLKSSLPQWMESGHIAYPSEIFSLAEYEVGRRILTYLDFEKAKDGSELPDQCDLYRLKLKSKQQSLNLGQRKRLQGS